MHEFNSPKKLRKNVDLDEHLVGDYKDMNYIEWDEDMRMDDKVEYGTDHYVKHGDGYVVKGKFVDAFGKIPA